MNRKLSQLNLTGDNGPYSDKALKNSVQHVVRVWPAVEFEATISLMALSILFTILMHS